MGNMANYLLILLIKSGRCIRKIAKSSLLQVSYKSREFTNRISKHYEDVTSIINYKGNNMLITINILSNDSLLGNILENQQQQGQVLLNKPQLNSLDKAKSKKYNNEHGISDSNIKSKILYYKTLILEKDDKFTLKEFDVDKISLNDKMEEIAHKSNINLNKMNDLLEWRKKFNPKMLLYYNHLLSIDKKYGNYKEIRKIWELNNETIGELERQLLILHYLGSSSNYYQSKDSKLDHKNKESVQKLPSLCKENYTFSSNSNTIPKNPTRTTQQIEYERLHKVNENAFERMEKALKLVKIMEVKKSNK